MNIQLVDKKNLVFRIANNDYQFVKPNILYKNFGIRINATTKGSTLGWNVENSFISYNQIKKSIKK